MRANRKKGYIRPYILMEGCEKRTNPAPVDAGLFWGRRAIECLLSWTIVRPGKIAVSIIVRLACAVDNLVRRTTLTISIEESVVRMVVFRGREVVAWKSAWIGDEFGPLDGPGNAHAGALRGQVTPSLLKWVIQGADRGHWRIVVDLPAYTSLIRNLTLSKMGRRYLGPIVESELLESLPFSKNEVDMSWCARPSPGLNNGRLEVFALAVPRWEMERTAGLLCDSGISPSAAYAKSTSLACAVGVSNTLIIHFEDNMAAIVSVLHGELEVVHKLACPRDESSPETAYDALARGVEQVEESRHGFDDAGDDEAGHPLAPVVLTGDIYGAGIDSRVLSEVLHRPVSALRTSMRHPPNFPAAQYASNIGLYLADRTGTGPWKTASTREVSRNSGRNISPGLNVLPKRHMPPPLPVIPVLIFLALLLAAAGTVPVWEKTNTVVGGANALEVRLDFLQGQAKHRRSLVDQELELAEKLQVTADEAAALESRLKDTQIHMQTLLARLQAITYDHQSSGVVLFGLNPEGDGFAISGTAETHGDVLRYAQTVRDSGHFGDARITELQGLGKEAGGNITFRIVATEPVITP